MVMSDSKIALRGFVALSLAILSACSKSKEGPECEECSDECDDGLCLTILKAESVKAEKRVTDALLDTQAVAFRIPKEAMFDRVCFAVVTLDDLLEAYWKRSQVVVWKVDDSRLVRIRADRRESRLVGRFEPGGVYAISRSPSAGRRQALQLVDRYRTHEAELERLIPGLGPRLCPRILCAAEAIPGARILKELAKGSGAPDERVIREVDARLGLSDMVLGGLSGFQSPCEECEMPEGTGPTGSIPPSPPGFCKNGPTLKFHADFEGPSNVIDQTPNPNPPTPPPNDRLDFLQPTAFSVQAPPPLSSNHMRAVRSSGPASATARFDGSPMRTGRACIRWRAVSVERAKPVRLEALDGLEPMVAVTLDGSGYRVPGLIGLGPAIVPDLTTPHVVSLVIDLDAERYELYLDDRQRGYGPLNLLFCPKLDGFRVVAEGNPLEAAGLDYRVDDLSVRLAD